MSLGNALKAIHNAALPALSNGQQEQLQLDAFGRLIVSPGPAAYQYIDPGTDDEQLGATGAIGDKIVGLLLVPTNVNAGYCLLQDGAGAELPVMAAGVLADLTPIWLPLNLVATGAGWKITSGGNVGIWAIGNFT